MLTQCGGCCQSRDEKKRWRCPRLPFAGSSASYFRPARSRALLLPRPKGEFGIDDGFLVRLARARLEIAKGEERARLEATLGSLESEAGHADSRKDRWAEEGGVEVSPECADS